MAGIITKINKHKDKFKKLLKICFFGLSPVSFVLAVILSYAYFYEIPRWKIIGDMPGFLRSAINTVRNIPYLPYAFKSSDLPLYNLYIEQSDYETLNNALPKDFNAVLSDDNKINVPAKLVIANDVVRDAKAGYRGDKYTHWMFEKKSWGFKFNEGDLLDGQSEIKLIIPDDRGYIQEYFDSYRARKMGLVVPDDKFVVLRINDGPTALYYQQEGWSNEFLKRHFGTDNGNLYGESGLVDDIFSSTMFWKKYVSVKGEEKNYGDLKHLLDLIKEPDNKKFKNEIVGLLDMESFYNWQVHSMLAGSLHQDGIHNMRLFFNKEAGKFFLIPWDVGLGNYGDLFTQERWGDLYDLDFYYNPLVTRILAIDEFYLERGRRLWDYIKQDNNLEEDLKFYDEVSENIKPALFNDSLKFNRNAVADEAIKNARTIIGANYSFLRDQLNKSKMFVMASFSENSHIPLTLDFQYVGASPIKFDGLGISFKGFNGQAFFQLYEDTNNNGVLDWEDAKVSDLKYREGALMGETGVLGDQVAAYGINKILYPDREYGDRGEQVSVRLASKRFFVVSSASLSVKSPVVDFNFSNGVTGSKINYQTQFSGNI